ncbi:Zn(2)-C6 fungal-type domain-containing protein [Fusarium keratoplasticum]|uniref:Zn(2)-C6 fungal-type domain-containing protein n=1 Tax=Fusarium keratoplasticum TaxID=1328300 RepID=A0ACC0QIW8_9HYPO|nr:Zn(2)-C6 fungal-type domain-containing protein [Fusarium keratoplasticum]KAI8655259.1 Zn(2)-C6 fungal-type domain-containing protein [Fusarium keratoplasticum]
MPVSTGRRMPLSCEPCRERKIKCPRNTNRGRGPCETCVRRGIPSSECVYLRDQWPRRHNQPAAGAVDNSKLVARIDRLEELLRQSVSNSANQPQEPVSNLPSPESSLPQSAGSFTGRNEVSPLKGVPSSSIAPPAGIIIRYESGHEKFEPSSSRWSSILRDNPNVNGIKTDLDGNDIGSMPFTTSTATIAELIDLLPPTSHCDELKRTYFDVFSPLFHILHDPTFEADYRRFQSDPEQVSLPWLALLFVILSIAVIALPEDSPLLRELGRRNSSLENTSLLSSRYRGAAMKCLEADHYLWRHNLNTLQAVILLIYGINHTHGQSWALLGTARNIALALGCQIDPTVFGMDRIRAEERRRCWAGLNMLYTIQNTTLGNLDSTFTPSSVKAPLDVNDDELVAGFDVPVSRNGPTQMSYLLLKFDLYGLCTRICSEVFGALHVPSYNTIQALDSEISALQEVLNYKYLFDTALPVHHAVQLNILFGYSHQLTLLLHRPILRQRTADMRYTRENLLTSQRKCIESSQALLSIHRTLYEDAMFRPYQWYNRGLGSFHAFHAAVCLAHICTSGMSVEASTKDVLRRELQGALEIFEQMAKTGMSAVCQKATPVLKKLIGMIAPQEIQHPVPSMASDSPTHQTAVSSDRSGLEFLEEPIDNLAPQQWLSPSTMGWEEWETFLENNSTANVL